MFTGATIDKALFVPSFSVLADRMSVMAQTFPVEFTVVMPVLSTRTNAADGRLMVPLKVVFPAPRASRAAAVAMLAVLVPKKPPGPSVILPLKTCVPAVGAKLMTGICVVPATGLPAIVIGPLMVVLPVPVICVRKLSAAVAWEVRLSARAAG